MVPKVLHYCWFGRGPMDELSLKCIESWKRFCPDYQIKVWNEDVFDVASNLFTKEAYAEKKWAFVTDYVRLYALYTEGGIYLDTDVEILKSFDDLLDIGGVVTSYQEGIIPAAVMLAEKGNPWIGELLSYYDNRHFRRLDGTLDMLENDRLITAISMQKWDFKLGDETINFGNVHILPSVYFAPFKKSLIVEQTYAVHHGNGSWKKPKNKNYWKVRGFILSTLRKILPENAYLALKRPYLKHFFLNRKID